MLDRSLNEFVNLLVFFGTPEAKAKSMDTESFFKVKNTI